MRIYSQETADKLIFTKEDLNPFGANFTKWSNTLKQFVGNLRTSCLSVFDQFVGLALKGLIENSYFIPANKKNA